MSCVCCVNESLLRECSSISQLMKLTYPAEIINPFATDLGAFFFFGSPSVSFLLPRRPSQGCIMAYTYIYVFTEMVVIIIKQRRWGEKATVNSSSFFISSGRRFYTSLFFSILFFFFILGCSC